MSPSSELTVLRTACALDCPDACTLDVTVDGDRIVEVDAAPADATDASGREVAANPLTDGWICSKVRRNTVDLVHGPMRIRTPVRRTGPKGSGSFAEISWEEALDEIASRIATAIETSGPGSVAPYLYSSSAGDLGRYGIGRFVWEALGAAKVEPTICAATMGAAWRQLFGTMASAAPDDLAASELIVVWGANPNVSNSHLTARIEAQRRQGAKLVVVDPRAIPLTRKADLHLALRPGTDAVLAMGLVAWMEREDRLDRSFLDQWVSGVDEYLEQCGPWTPEAVAETCRLEVDDVVTLADWYSSIHPAMLRAGWGIERNQNGGAGTRSVMSLPAFAGQFGQRGGGVFNSVKGAIAWDDDRVRRSVLGNAPTATPPRSVNMNRLGETLVNDEGGRIEVLFVQGANPASSCPNQELVVKGLERDDLFTVVHELTMTDTAELADIVLPATTQFEVDDVVSGYGYSVLQDAPAVIPRVGEARTNDEVSCAIGIRLGLDPEVWTPDPALIHNHGTAGQSLPLVAAAEGPIQFVDVFPQTPSGRIEMAADAAGVDVLPTFRSVESDRYPLALLSPATSKTVSSVFGHLEPAGADLRMNGDDMADRGLADGDLVTVSNERSTLEVTVRSAKELPPGVAAMPKGMWRTDGFNGKTVNALIPDTIDNLAGGATFNDARVQVTAR